MDCPARTAEEEMPNADNMGDPVGGGLATLPALDVFLIFHASIVQSELQHT